MSNPTVSSAEPPPVPLRRRRWLAIADVRTPRNRRRWRIARPWLFALAVVVAALAQLRFLAPVNLPRGHVPTPYLILSALAILLAAIGWSRDGAAWFRAPPAASPIDSRIWLGVRAVAAAAGLVAAAELLLRLQARHDDALALLLWLGAVLAIACAFFPEPRPLAILAWVREHRVELLLVAALLALSAPIYLLNLNDIPWRVQSDETAMGTDAAIFATRDPGRIFDLGWLGHPRLFFYLQYLGAQLFGWSFGSIRIPAALSGWLMVAVAFALGRVTFGRVLGMIVGIAAALLTATSVAQLTYARLGLNNAPSELLYATAFLFLALTWRSRQSWPAALAGVSAGLGLYLYYGSRMLPLVCLGYLTFLVVIQAGWRRIRLRQVATYVVTAGVTVLPQALDISTRPMTYLDRFIGLTTSDGSTAHATLATVLPTVIHGLWLNGIQSILVFYAIPDRTIFFYDGSRALFDVLLGPLVVLGLGLLVVRLDDPRLFLLGAWFWPNWLAGGAILQDAPYSPHIVCVFLAVIVVAGLVLARAAAPLRQLPFRRAGSLVAIVAPIAFALVVGYRELSSYWTVWSGFSRDDAQTQVARWAFAAGPRQYDLVEGGGIVPTIAFAATVYGALQRNFPTWPSRNVPTLTPGASVTFYFESFTGNDKLLSQIQQQFPGGKLIVLRGPKGDTYYQVYDTRVSGQPIAPSELDPSALQADSQPLPDIPITTVKVQQLIPIQVPGGGEPLDIAGLAFAPDGRFAIADPKGRLVRLFDARGKQASTFSAPDMQEPFGLVTDPNGDLLVLDASSPIIVRRFGWDGAPKGEISVGGGFYHPRGIAVAGDGSILIADTGTQRLVVRSPDGQLRATVVRTVPTWTAGWPVYVVAGSNNSIVAATSLGLIARLDANGQATQSAPIRGITREPAGFAAFPGTNTVAATWPDQGLVVFFDEGTLKPIGALRVDRGDGGGPISLAPGPGGSLALVESNLPAIAILR